MEGRRGQVSSESESNEEVAQEEEERSWRFDADSSPPPTMLEALGDHLYRKVQDAGYGGLDIPRVTGVLLELGEKQVLKLLQNETLLEQSIQHVIEYIPEVWDHSQQAVFSHGSDGEEDKPDTQGTSTSNDVAENLYEQVCQQEPKLGPHLTGMLLEMGETQVKSLLDSPIKLTQAVGRAKAAYMQHRQYSTHE